MSRSIRRRQIAALALVPALTFTMSCGKAAEKVGEKVAEKALEDAGVGNVDIGKDGGIKIESKDGTFETDADGNYRVETKDGVSTAGAGLPEGWPDDVPVPEGTNSFGASSPEGLMVTLTAAGNPGDLYDGVKSSLGGWTVEDEFSSSGSGSEMRSARFIDGERNVTVSITSDGSGGSMLTMLYAAGEN